jgi:DNA processing protein
MPRADLPYWIAFSRVPGIGRVRLNRLLDAFGDLAAAWRAPASGLRAAGLDEKPLTALQTLRSSLNPEIELDKLDEAGVHALTWDDPSYPARLKEITELPPVLYVKGGLTREDDLSIAIVGTRKATAYGREATAHIAGGIARARVTVVSGLARGIDTEAHKAALEAGGRTIAVLGSGLDIIYPRENARLARQIAEQGCLLSEHPLGTPPDAGHFPRRNRILSGISRGVLVVEADLVSGAQNTVQHALEQGRDVYAVPGSIFSPASRGANRLIRDGAKPVTGPEDVLDELNVAAVAQQLEMKALLPASETEALVLRHLSAEPVHVDEVRRATGLAAAEVSSALAMMELKGMVRSMGGMNYVLAR